MSNINEEEKVEASLLEEEKVPDVEPISYVSHGEEETPPDVEADIANAFDDTEDEIEDDIPTEDDNNDTEEELLVETHMSDAAANLENALTNEIINSFEGKSNDEDNVESMACSVCYTELDKNNIVNTPCKHNYCWECFFKWIHNAPTCPMCRKNFVSENAWYENRDAESDKNDCRELVNIFQRELVGLSREFKRVNNEIKVADHRLTNIKKESDENLKRLITSRELISYNEGYIAGQRDVTNDMFKNKYIKEQSKFNTPWFQGYSKAQWELRFTNRISSGNREPRIKKYGEVDNEEIKEFNKHNMGFKIREREEDEEITKEKSKNKKKNKKKNKNKLDMAANTPLPEDSDGEEKTENFDYTAIF